MLRYACRAGTASDDSYCTELQYVGNGCEVTPGSTSVHGTEPENRLHLAETYSCTRTATLRTSVHISDQLGAALMKFQPGNVLRSCPPCVNFYLLCCLIRGPRKPAVGVPAGKSSLHRCIDWVPTIHIMKCIWASFEEEDKHPMVNWNMIAPSSTTLGRFGAHSDQAPGDKDSIGCPCWTCLEPLNQLDYCRADFLFSDLLYFVPSVEVVDVIPVTLRRRKQRPEDDRSLGDCFTSSLAPTLKGMIILQYY